MRQWSIRCNRLELERRIRVQHFLLGLDNDLVLVEPFENTVMQRMRDPVDVYAFHLTVPAGVNFQTTPVLESAT